MTLASSSNRWLPVPALQKSTILQEAGQLYVLALAVRLVQARADTWNATKMTTATSLGDLLSRTPSYEC